MCGVGGAAPDPVTTHTRPEPPDVVALARDALGPDAPAPVVERVARIVGMAAFVAGRRAGMREAAVMVRDRDDRARIRAEAADGEPRPRRSWVPPL